MEQFKLIKTSPFYKEQIASYRQEFIDNDESMDGTGNLKREEDIEKYIATSLAMEDVKNVPPHLVPATQFMFIRECDNKLVGMIQIRHYFNSFLEQFGGHIGYSVRKSERGKGYAKLMLKAALPHCKALGLDKVLITCLENNIASEKTIKACGGIYESTVLESSANVFLKRFWINL